MVTLPEKAVIKEWVDRMAEVVVKLKTLLRASGREWDVMGKVWGLHGQREVLRTITNFKVRVVTHVV